MLTQHSPSINLPAEEINLEALNAQEPPGSLVVKKPLTKQDTWVRSRAWEDPLEKEIATHPNILA